MTVLFFCVISAFWIRMRISNQESDTQTQLNLDINRIRKGNNDKSIDLIKWASPLIPYSSCNWYIFQWRILVFKWQLLMPTATTNTYGTRVPTFLPTITNLLICYRYKTPHTHRLPTRLPIQCTDRYRYGTIQAVLLIRKYLRIRIQEAY